ncbi:MAG TPA: GGDEF domain-containing protein [Burkholderiaceae bacterium]|nr:GGDEF domain-containing protein [Burkholderiaceae bacterium]
MDRTAPAPFRPLRRAWSLAVLLLCGAAAAPLQAQSVDDATQRILALENTGRARPYEAAQALEALLPSTPSGSRQRIEVLTVQGLTLAAAAPPEAIERSAARLEEMAREPRAASASAAAAAALLVRARSLARGGSLQRADAMMQEAMAQLPNSLLPRERFRFVFAHGYIKDRAGQFEAAVRLNHEALALADTQPEPWRWAEARANLAYSYYGAKQLERAHTLGLEAITIAKNADDAVALGRAYNVTGIVLDGLGDQPGERRSFEAAIAAAQRAGAKVDEARYLANLADFFLKNGDYKTALTRAEAALPLARDLKDANTEMVALANIGLAHIGLQEIEIGKRYVREAMAIDEGRGSVSGVSDLHEELGTYLEKAGDLTGAAQALHHHRRLATTLLRDGDQKAILAMQEQYDADRRKQALALLNRESEITAEQLRRGDLRQRLWWLLAAAFVLSFAVVALLYRRVRQTNAMLSTSNEQLKVQSERDPLTGLANRRHFQAVMRQLADDGKLTGTVFLIDIDHFKHINDRHGHGTGDAVLVDVARRLRETLREQDLIVRWGGEEFLVVVRSLAAEQVDALAQRMLGVLDRAPVVCGTQRIAVTASIGFATFPIGPAPLRVSWERAINLVDTAMYLAKAHGRNRAYGVRLLHARDEPSLEAITHSLETAWRDGQVELTLLQGRAPLSVAVAA